MEISGWFLGKLTDISGFSLFLNIYPIGGVRYICHKMHVEFWTEPGHYGQSTVLEILKESRPWLERELGSDILIF